MADTPPPDSPASTDGPMLPDAVALVPARGPGRSAVAVSPDGEISELSPDEALRLIEREPVMLVHAGFIARRIARGMAFREAGPHVLDLLELFAFVRPAEPCLPTAEGVARALGLDPGETPEDLAMILREAAAVLLRELQNPRLPGRPFAARTAFRMAEAGWAWGPGVMAALRDALRGAAGRESKLPASRGFDIWNELPDWEERPPLPPAGSLPVSAAEAQVRLAELAGDDAEARPGQVAFAGLASAAFAPRERAGEPNVVLAEAGTGIGKTIGYVAPASLWAERNRGTVWISTYTKNLQRQLDQELTRLYPDTAEKAEKAVIRKGRENYLCLLNFAEMADRAALGGNAVAVGLVARWAMASRDGDMVGGDFPAWLAARLSGAAGRTGLTDRRGECVYTACPHYKKCFIERAIRKARRAEIVVANHALVMRQAALDQTMGVLTKPAQPADDASGGAEEEIPSGREARTRFVFDEGHHIFDAADGAFSTSLSALEAAELRRWIRGAEGQRGRRGRGIEERAGDLIADDKLAEEALTAALSAASALPAPGWSTRLNDGQPRGAAEKFLALVRQQVHARAEESGNVFSLETETAPAVSGLAEAAHTLDEALSHLVRALRVIADRLRARLDEEAEDLDTATRIRMDAAARGIERRAGVLIPAWQSMLKSLGGATPEIFVDWFSVERLSGREIDVGMHRHWRDPTIPFAGAVLEPAHGVLITSATLRDQLPDEDIAEGGWESAEIRTGVSHLALPAKRAFMGSPFNYAEQVRIFVVRDVGRDKDAIAAAYRELFRAADGGALGLFTAIHRLRAVHERIVSPLEEAGLTLYAQHVDQLDTSTLVDIFRAERHACLLGTDAVRDGVDVPGDSLRMIVFDRVPWPRRDILHKARSEQFGKARYDDMLTRLRLKQAFGRLIRRASDRGVFVMLDSRLPTRLTSAFPPGAEIHRIGLAEAIAESRRFLGGEAALAGPEGTP
ncbi:ATP-dependent DNA helicase [Parvibaculum sp.]|uniref:ATP-dependent DNA helicase n=1 Tax=Parvibaculum sp. TaxID=2024848 RepID=UPI003919E391